MKVLLLGATGRTGLQIIEEGLKEGHQISAIARKPDKLKDYDIEITPGTPYDYDTVEKAITGCDAVINTLNVSRKSDNPWAPLAAPKDMISRSASHAMKAMYKAGIKRYIALGTSWAGLPMILHPIILTSNLKYAIRDHEKQDAVLKNSSLDYTICRAPKLHDEITETGGLTIVEGEKPSTMKLSRTSAAIFFLRIIENHEYIRETIAISDKPK